MRVGLAIAGVMYLSLSCGTGTVIGILVGEKNTYHRRFLAEQKVIAPLLASDPAFAGVRTCEMSSGGIYLEGVVRSKADLERLRAGVTQAIGGLHIEQTMAAVDIAASLPVGQPSD